MPSFEEIQKARILNSFNTDERLSELTKAEILDIEKGGKRAMIGEKRTFAGREYIKTSDGWKFHGKGTGSKAQSHVAGALEHRVDSNKVVKIDEQISRYKAKLKELEDFNSENAYNLSNSIRQEIASLEAQKLHLEDNKNAHKDATDSVAEIGSTVKVVNDKDLPTGLFGLGGQNLKVVGYEKGTLSVPKFLVVEDKNGERHSINPNYTEKPNPKPTHKDATDHFVEDNGKHYIDSLDPDSGEKKFKPGDKVKYKDDSGKQHKGTLSDREHPDGDMFEVNRDEDVTGKVKKLSFEEILDDSEGKKLIEAIEHGSSDKNVIDQYKKELKDKFGYDYKD